MASSAIAVFKKLKLVKMLLSIQKITSLILLMCVAASYFAMQIVLAPSAGMTNEIRSSPMTDSYSIDFSENGISDQSLERLKQLFSGDLAVNDQYATSGFYGSFSEDQPTILGLMNCGNNSWYVQGEGRYFSENEERSGENVAVISYCDYEWADFDIEKHFVRIGDDDYKIVGLGEYMSALQFFIGKTEVYEKLSHERELENLLESAFNEHDQHGRIDELQQMLHRISQAVLIPYTTYEQKKMTPTVVCLIFSSETGRAKAQMRQELSALFPEAVVTAPPDAEKFMETSMKRQMAISLILSCSCLIFLYALFAFWIQQNQKALRSCRIVGGSEKAMQGLVFMSWFAILLLGYIASVGILEICAPLFSKLHMDVHLPVGYRMVLFIVPVMITFGLMKINLKDRRWKGIAQ